MLGEGGRGEREMEVGFAVLSDELAGWRAGFLRSSCEPLAAGRCARMLDLNPTLHHHHLSSLSL